MSRELNYFLVILSLICLGLKSGIDSHIVRSLMRAPTGVVTVIYTKSLLLASNDHSHEFSRTYDFSFTCLNLPTFFSAFSLCILIYQLYWRQRVS